MSTQDDISAECLELEHLLLAKNQAYGDSALEPIRVFSRADAVDGILIRIDDKIRRIQNLGSFADAGEDTLLDLMGYLVLLRIALKRRAKVPEARPTMPSSGTSVAAFSARGLVPMAPPDSAPGALDSEE